MDTYKVNKREPRRANDQNPAELTSRIVIVAKRQRRLSGIDDLVISLSAKGLTHGEISAHLGRDLRGGGVEADYFDHD